MRRFVILAFLSVVCPVQRTSRTQAGYARSARKTYW